MDIYSKISNESELTQDEKMVIIIALKWRNRLLYLRDRLNKCIDDGISYVNYMREYRDINSPGYSRVMTSTVRDVCRKETIVKILKGSLSYIDKGILPSE